ncbi:MAG: glycoside hydrolase family 55 protein [Rickettsiales bacterium]
MFRLFLLFFLSVQILVNVATPAVAECLYPSCIEFPKDSGVINVRDFGAKGDGVSDDTDAIKKALAASGDDTKTLFWQDKIVYLPDGIYLVSSPLIKLYKEGRFASGMILIGQSRDGTIIKLKDNAVGYNNPDLPKSVIFTTAKLLDGSPTSGGKDYTNKGEGNDAYNNFIENLTIDVGNGNKGAVAIDYLANNFGAIRNVTIKAPEDSGNTAILMTRKWAGPALIKNVDIVGFDVGIDVASTEYGITLENINIIKQRSIGLRNRDNVISADGLKISDSPLPLVNETEKGLVVISGGSLIPFNADEEAYINKGSLNLRDVLVKGSSVDAVYQGSDKIAKSSKDWSLPVKHSPVVAKSDSKDWVAVKHDSPDSDAAAAINKAFNSGASTIYFPHGIYSIGSNITIPRTVKRIIGMGSTIRAVKQRSASLSRERGFFYVKSGKEPLVIEKIAFDNSWLGNQVAVELKGKRALVLKDVIGAGVTTLKRNKNGGEVFLENSCCGFIDISGSNGVWARQLNTEGGGVRIKNNGSPLWISGIKTEHNCTVIENKNGAVTELMGGLIYMVRPYDSPRPAFVNDNSKMSLSYVEEAFFANSVYKTHLKSEIAGSSENVMAEELPQRGKGRIIPQLISE